MEEDAMEDVGTSRSIPSDDVLLAAFAKINKRRREEVVRQRRNNQLKKNIAESSSEAERTAATVDLFSCVRMRSKRQLCSEDEIDAILCAHPTMALRIRSTFCCSALLSKNHEEIFSLMFPFYYNHLDIPIFQMMPYCRFYYMVIKIFQTI